MPREVSAEASAAAAVGSVALQTRLSLRAVPGESSGGDRPGYATGSLCRGETHTRELYLEYQRTHSE